MGLRHNDLTATIHPRITIDEFEPKSGTSREIIVLGFYAMDEAPAKDLNTFIQRGNFDAIDTEVSPNPDENGDYLVFVEFERNDHFRDILPKFIEDIENITGEQEWMVKAYMADEAYPLMDPQLQQYIITEPGGYKTKAEAKQTADLEESFKDALVKNLTVRDGYVIFTNGIDTVAGELVDYGICEDITLKHKLVDVAINFSPRTEINALDNMLGEAWNVYDMNRVVALENQRGELFLMNDVQFVYGSTAII